MTTIDDGRDHATGLDARPSSGALLRGSDIDDSVDEKEILQEEIERLRKRVVDLETTVAEYRSQMTRVLGSASWRLTSPLRATASRARGAKIKARRGLRRIASPSRGEDKVLTAGLFFPPPGSLPVGSPLRRPIEVNALRRPREADGPRRRPAGQPTVAVVAHVHYPELWGDIEDRLARMPGGFDLIVTVTEGMAESVVPTIMRRHPRARVEVVPNRGRDWAPLVALVNRGLLSGYDAVAKVHTKKSEHRIDGDGWRLALLDGVLESPQQIRRVIDLLREDPSAGLVVPTGHVAGTESWGSDQPIVEALAARLPMAFDPDALQFPGGSMFWCRPWLLERLADLDLGYHDFELEAGQYDATTAHALERLVGVFAHVAGMDVVESMDVTARLRACRRSPQVRPQVYAFYLPQYHPIPENDAAWGEGFSDWVNVRGGRPLFEGHRQPLLPSEEVGFYDLRDTDVQRSQAETAREYGIDGFVFHYYWFDGRKLLDTPLNQWLADPALDLPLALCWANEPWTRRWDGLNEDVLVAQDYGDDWANRFWDDIAPALRDPRYLRMDGAPILVVYRIGEIPDALEAIDTWRRRAAADGHPGLRVLAVMPSRDVAPLQPQVIDAVDGLVAFPPGSAVELVSLAARVTKLAGGFNGDVLSYDAAIRALVPAEIRGTRVYRGLMPGWDNTARRGSAAYVFHGSNPVTWRRACRAAFEPARGTDDLVFINAWNEWAEGAATESSRAFGAGYLSSLLEATGR